MTYQQNWKISREAETQRLLNLRLAREIAFFNRLAKERDAAAQEVREYLADFDREYGDLCNAVS